MQVEPERQPKEERAATPPERPPLNGLTFLAVIVLAITGNIVRDLFSAYPPFYYETYLLPNFIGSFVMGLVVGSELASYAPISAVGISVGFCGSVTTFSEWMLAVGAAPAGDVGVIMTITGLCTPFIALLAGSDLGRAGRRRWCPSSTKDGRFGFWMDVVVLTVGVVVALAACLAIAFAWSTERSPIVYAALIGIGGALLRYLLSWWLNFVWLECSTFIPIGTFVCNVIAPKHNNAKHTSHRTKIMASNSISAFDEPDDAESDLSSFRKLPEQKFCTPFTENVVRRGKEPLFGSLH